MIYRLSSRYQKAIALSLLYLFFISGVGAVKAQLLNNNLPYYDYASRSKNYNSAASYIDAPLAPVYSDDNEKEKKAKKVQSNRQRFTAPSAKFDKGFIGGPSQPEMTAFKPAGADNLVSPFTGDFSYNIPLLDVGGYPVNMFYNSGITMEQEASWVGLGWGINPGTITRNMRGLPDDFDGSDQITKTQSFRDDKTFGITTGASIKLAGFPLKLGANMGLAWNNKLGVSAEAGVNAALSISSKNATPKTYELTLGAGLNASSRNGASYSPSITLSREMGKGSYGNLSGSIGVGYNYSSRVGLSSMHLDMNVSESYKRGEDNNQSMTWGSVGGTLSFAYPSVVPSITKPFTRENYSLELSMGGEAWALNAHLKLKGYYSRIYLADEDKVTTHPAFGMLHLQKGNNNKDALLDFNRANDGVYTPNTPTIAMPVYTYDVFSINGEGTGGSFRAYRGDVGHMRDATVKSKENAFGLGVDLGFGNLVHVGADLNYVYSPTQSGDWVTNNMASSAFSYQQNDKDYQAVYFKNPGEKTVPDATFQNAISGEELVRFKMANTASANPMLLSKLIRYDATKNVLGEKNISASETKKINRDKRTQIISFLNAEESERVGMNSKLYSYNALGSYENKIIYSANCNKAGIDSLYRNHDVNHAPAGPQVLGDETEAFRHKHHISEIDVLGTDGKKYVYGLPVYNKKQLNVTFSIDASQKKSNTKATYDLEDNSMDNSKGRDWILEKEEVPAYTHSYLLTELVSPNYVDLTGNGITEDDMGDAVKFNYSKYSDYKWRTPAGDKTASYSSGLKTDEKDDKAHYVYGEREQWYLYSVESKNMIARFFVKSDRKDGRSVADENGVLDNDASKGMKRLEKIALYSKGDLNRYGNNAKPIKTIRFFQSYKLCKNNPGVNDLGSNIETGYGKLTLDSIWITYNGNDRKPKSRYVFYYPTDNNPNYSFEQSDRWGNYKPATDNPAFAGGNLSNEEFPYSIQDKVKADKNAAAWAMNKVLLPSGAVITVDYESDSYAYVQDKKAGLMCQVLGFGTSESSLPATIDLPKLYSNNGAENDRVYIQLPTAISSTGQAGKNEFAARYLQDVKQLYLKLSVTMPVGAGLSGIAGEETIPVYADIAGYGLISPTVAWIKVNSLSGHTPMVQSALQFLTKQLPGKAYKGYDLSENGGLKAIVTAMAGMLNSVGSMFSGEINALKGDKKCQKAVPEKSFARLSCPTLNKLGGGYRVKKVIISDSWDKMTGQTKAIYGKEYVYTTTELINGKPETISSGVASWEPSIGGEENPNRDIMRFVDHNKGGPYDYGVVEMPLGEMFYPSPMVGYSRVEVLSIHRDTVKNQPTRQVTEYYTNKDFPYKSSYTDLKGDANAKYEPAKIMQLLRIDMMKGIAQSQGFLVETNDMHGKEKSNAVYTVSDAVTPMSYTRYFYNVQQTTDKSYRFNHDFPVIAKADGKVNNAVIGRDIEVMTDFREHHSETITANLSINFDGFMVGFFPIPLTNLLQPVVREGTMYRSAGILKLVTHYSMIDSVVVIDKGSMVSTKNLVYDAETGNPLLTRTQNEHNKPVYNFNYPAHWAYSGMGPAYKNIDAVYSGVQFTHGILTAGAAGIFDILESGDEIYTVAKNNTSQTYVAPCDDPLTITAANYAWNTLDKNPANKIWAVHTSKAGASPGGWVFMDVNGNPYNAVDATIRIIRSGKRNLLDQSVASVSSLSNPIVNGQLQFSDASNIISAGAATFKDNWRVDNNWYRVIETRDSIAYARVHKMDIPASDFLSVNYYRHYRDNGDIYEGPYRSIDQGPSIPTYKRTQRYWKKDHWWQQKKSHNIDDRKNSFVLFNYGMYYMPADAQLYKGMLALYSHSNYPLFPVLPPPNYTYPSANHSNMHANTSPLKSGGILGEVNSLNKSWYATGNTTANADTWINNYFNSSTANISYGKGIIPIESSVWESFLYGAVDKRINVTLPMQTNTSATLLSQKKVGFRIRLSSDESGVPNYDHEFINYRCFWSPGATTPCLTRQPNDDSSQVSNATAPSGCSFASPVLSYYYYAWGDSLVHGNYYNDPDVNKMLTKFIRSITANYCKSKFDRKAMNPYVEGILGNWRVDSAYVFYGERKESDPAAEVDTRIGGTIKNYASFWNFGNTPAPQASVYLTRNNPSNNPWVWNSAITQYNRKGYEIENTDPLGRFNSGLYGYNQQLPIALANNSRVREIMFDGFEDYDYQTGQACANCLPHRYFNYTSAISGQIDNTQRHTGQYSLRINAGQNISFAAPVTSEAAANAGYGLKIQNSTTSYTNQVLGSGGTSGGGLTASWYNHAVIGSTSPPLEPAPSSTYPQATLISTVNNSLPFIASAQDVSPLAGVSPTFFSVKWAGQLQAPKTGTYRFRITGNDGYRIKIGNTVLTATQQWNSPPFTPSTVVSDPIVLTVGQVYPVEISFYNKTSFYQLDVKWNYSNNVLYNTSTGYYSIPATHLYSPSASSFRQVITTQETCYRLDSSQVTGNALTDSLSLIQSKKMLLSGWVKVGTANCCFPATYNNNSNSITVSYNNQSYATETLKPAGPVIEGWQRYEGVFTIPGNASSIAVSLKNSSSEPVFFDDIRLHPYNANMKSYVYHSSSLRLMAELDENNYSSLYEYDDDGTLTRVKKETQAGIKTITETRSATQKKITE
ncbi:MAG: PA14 domain-containing protein [Ferruginibacter sp.]